MDNAFLTKLTEIVEAHLSDPNFNVDELARIMGLSYSSLRRKVSTYTRKPANQLIREIRLRKAFEILQQEDVTAAEVAYRTGFSSPNYFSTCFHDFFGYPPGELRKLGKIDQTGQTDREDFDDASVTRRDLSGKWTQRILLLTAMALVLIAMAIIVVKVVDWNPGRLKSIAVLPVRSLDNDPETQRFCGGLQEQLLTELKRMNAFEVRSRVSSDKYENPGRSLPEIGKELNADLIIRLVVSSDADEYKVWVHLYDAKKDIDIFPFEYSQHKENLFKLQEGVVNAIIGKLKTELFPENAGTGHLAMSGNPEAGALYLQGRSYSDPLNFNPEMALECFQKAVRLDPALAGAHLGIANILNTLYPNLESRRDSIPEEIRLQVERALDLQPGMPEAYEQRGLMYFVTGEFEKALETCSLALKKNPGKSQTLDIMARSFLSMGNGNQALDCMNQVMRENAYSPGYLLKFATILDHLRDYNNAKIRYHNANAGNPLNGAAIYGQVDISMKTTGDPTLSMALLDTLVSRGYPPGPDSLSLYYQYAVLDLYEGKYLQAVQRFSGWQGILPQGPPYFIRPRYMMCAMAYGLMKKPDIERQYYDSTRLYLESLQQISAANREDPRVMSALGIAFAGLGLTDKALNCAEKASGLLNVKPDAWLGPYAMEDVAFIYTKTGKYPEALKIVRDLLSSPGPLTMKTLELDPRWAPLRKLPGFEKMKHEF